MRIPAVRPGVMFTALAAAAMAVSAAACTQTEVGTALPHSGAVNPRVSGAAAAATTGGAGPGGTARPTQAPGSPQTTQTARSRRTTGSTERRAPVQCGVDSSSPAITDAVTRLEADRPGEGSWAFAGDSNYDPCADLSYAVVDKPGGTVSSPMQLMFFHNGDYVGTGTWCALPFTAVTGTTDDAVHVEYRWPRGGDANANPTGRASTTYRWDGDQVRMDPSLPDGMPNLHC